MTSGYIHKFKKSDKKKYMYMYTHMTSINIIQNYS